MAAFKQGFGNWTDYRKQFCLSVSDEIDLHFGERDRFKMSYDEVMGQVEELVQSELRRAQEEGRQYLMFNHGWSSSESWKKRTARSVVRAFMRSPRATPLIDRKSCIQHRSVFLAKIRPKPTR
jgi:hypothetical protein